MIESFWTVIGITFVAFEIIAIFSAFQALITARTSQGAIAWALFLIALPIISVPLYWVFGRNKFEGYATVRRERDMLAMGMADDITHKVMPAVVSTKNQLGDVRVLEELAQLPFVRGNDAQLLIDGEATFQSMFDAISKAEHYVLAEFFIVHDDPLGREFKALLIRQAQAGRRVYLLYDELGSAHMTKDYLDDLESNGVQVSGMNTTRGMRNPFQLNFRNHRKIVVIDGKVAFIGGHNVGDEYVGRDTRLSPWRDTHVKIEGPAALAAQHTFWEDWHWANEIFLEWLYWEPHFSNTADKMMFVLPSGPADKLETCGLFFTHAINSAKHRLWIASPYFVPDESIVNALKLAAMRKVDVRILIPGLADKPFIKLAAMSYVEEALAIGVRIYEYGDGFMHQKVCLIDDSVSCIGTANFDNRSFRLNFEITLITIDAEFGKEVESMLEADFAKSEIIKSETLEARPWTRKFGSRIARLFSPVL